MKDLRSLIDRILEDFLAQQEEVLVKAEPRAAEMAGNIRKMIGGGGKRIRPVFCYWGYRAAGKEHSESIMRAAASLELLHTMALIHDDIIDRSSTRRGSPTLHRESARLRLEAGASEEESQQFGISAALLTGDLAFILSDHLMAASGFSPNVLAEAEGPLHDMRSRAIAGQYLDLIRSGTSRNPHDPERARRIARLKTGSYTVEGPLLVGAALAGGDQRVRETLSVYGSALGEGYQLQDDLLGVFGDPESTGKSGEADVYEGKATLVIAEALRLAAPGDRELIESIWGREGLGPGDIESLREAITRSGATEAVLVSIRDLVARAKGSLADLNPPPLLEEATIVLNELADLLVEPSLKLQSGGRE